MSAETEEAKPKSVLERHAQTVIAGVILALCLWMASSVSSVGTEVAVLKTQLTAIQARLADFRTMMNSRYRREDADKDFRLRDAQLADILRRLERLENERRPRVPNP